MIVFIDESGDPGLKTKMGSSMHFVLSMISFSTEGEVVKTRQQIVNLRKELGLSNIYELKFNKRKKDFVVKVLNSIKGSDLKINSIVLDKEKVNISQRKKRSKNIYKFLLLFLLKQNLLCEKEIILRIDGSSSKLFKQALTLYVRKNLRQKVHIKVEIVNSRSDVLIQLVDIVAGSIRRSYSKDKKDSNRYKNIIKGKIENEILIKEGDLAPILEQV